MRITLNEYLGLQGVSAPMSDFMIDKLRLPHGQTLRQKTKMEKDAEKAAHDYAERRNAATQEYFEKVASGEIQPKSRIEVLIENANGHPDNESTKAAIRTLVKRGIDYTS